MLSPFLTSPNILSGSLCPFIFSLWFSYALLRRFMMVPSIFPFPCHSIWLLSSTTFVLLHSSKHKIAYTNRHATECGIKTVLRVHMSECVRSSMCPMGECTAAHICRDHSLDEGNLVRRDLCLSQYLDRCIFTGLHLATDWRWIPNCSMKLYYICASTVQKTQKQTKKICTLGSLMECSRVRWEWLLSFSLTSVR